MYSLLGDSPWKLLWRMDANVKFVKRVWFQQPLEFQLMIKGADACNLAFDRAWSKVLIEIFDIASQHVPIFPVLSHKFRKLPQVDPICLNRVRRQFPLIFTGLQVLFDQR